MFWEVLPQLGVGIAAVGTLGFVVKLFIEHLGKRDNFLSDLITNHLKHHNDNLEKLTDKIDQLIHK